MKLFLSITDFDFFDFDLLELLSGNLIDSCLAAVVDEAVLSLSTVELMSVI